MTTASFVDRLDAARLNPFHWKLLVVAGTGWLLDAMDVTLVPLLLAPISLELALDATRAGLVLSGGVAGMLVGAAASGRLADRYGRRTIFEVTLLVFSLGSLLTALAPSFETLLAARVVAGLGLGGELPVVATLVSELAPRARRARLVSLLGPCWAGGAVAAGLIGAFLLPAYGWRGAFLVTSVPALYVAYVRRALPESPRYLAQRGRLNEADAAVRRVERAGGAPLITVARAVAPPAAPAFAPAGLWSRGLVRRTAMLWTAWAGLGLASYGILAGGGGPLGERGQALPREAFYVTALAAIPGYLGAAWLAERWGRRPTLVTYALGAGASALLLGSTGTSLDGRVYAPLFALFVLGALAVLQALTVELYPTAIRAGGAGIAASIGWLGALVGPLVIPGLVGAWGPGAALVLLAIVLAVVAADIALLAEETRGRSLEELAEAGLAVARGRGSTTADRIS